MSEDVLALVGRKIMEAVADAILAERERCAKLCEEGFLRPVGTPYNPERRTKNDKCPHDRYMYEDCEQCCADEIRRAP